LEVEFADHTGANEGKVYACVDECSCSLASQHHLRFVSLCSNAVDSVQVRIAGVLSRLTPDTGATRLRFLRLGPLLKSWSVSLLQSWAFTLPMVGERRLGQPLDVIEGQAVLEAMLTQVYKLRLRDEAKLTDASQLSFGSNGASSIVVGGYLVGSFQS
jgi:hypothetical protein